MTSYTDQGVVIKRSNFGEADRIITLFTQSHGKVTVIARGVRKPTSKRAGSIELFNLIKASFIKGRGELDTLGEVQSLETFPSWRKHLGRVNIAYQLVEIIDKITPDHQPHPKVFAMLLKFLSEIGNLKIDWELEIGNWKLQILQDLGYWPEDKIFVKDIDQFIENLINRPLHSPKLLHKIRH